VILAADGAIGQPHGVAGQEPKPLKKKNHVCLRNALDFIAIF
jgi:hypothetical protein